MGAGNADDVAVLQPPLDARDAVFGNHVDAHAVEAFLVGSHALA